MTNNSFAKQTENSLPSCLLRKCAAFTLAGIFSPHCASFRKTAFTLAEVLITLGIIGVVAAMTISQFVTNYQKKVTLEQFKVAYQMFSEVMQRALADNGGELVWTEDMTAERNLYGNNPLFSKAYFEPYISAKPTTTHKAIPIKNSSRKGYFLVSYPAHNANPNAIYRAPMCTQKNICYWITATGSYSYLFFDINGPKGPNIAGRDVFGFSLAYDYWKYRNGHYAITGLINNTNAVPRLNQGRDKIKENCNKTDSGSWAGFSCALLIIYDDFKISPDYPW